MKTFFNILHTINNSKIKHYPDEPFVILNNNGDNQHIIYLMNHIFYKEKQTNNTIQFSKNAFAKLNSLNDILKNPFYSNELKETIFNTFTKAQKCYYAFSRLVYIYKIKKHKYIVTDDLMINKLDPYNKLTFILVEENNNYLFNINELVTIIETEIVNPYNNQAFSIATLYNIYFQLKHNHSVISLLFHCFFLENFNKYLFSEQHESIIRENAIKKYIFNSPYILLYTSVFYMLEDNRYTRKLLIHNQFPKKILVDIFRPFLFHYYMIHYYIKNTSKIYISKLLLHIKLKKFYEYNPLFGRVTIKLTNHNNKIIKREYSFNQKYISFYNITNY